MLSPPHPPSHRCIISVPTLVREGSRLVRLVKLTRYTVPTLAPTLPTHQLHGFGADTRSGKVQTRQAGQARYGGAERCIAQLGHGAQTERLKCFG